MTVSRRASPNSFCAASALGEGSIWKETASLLTDDPQPGAARARLPREVPGRASWSRRHGAAPPCSGAQGSPRPAARAAARTASGCRPASPPRPSALGRTSTRQRGARGGSRHSAPTGSVPRSWSRRASWGTAAAPGAGDTYHGRDAHSQDPAPSMPDGGSLGLVGQKAANPGRGWASSAVRRIGLLPPQDAESAQHHGVGYARRPALIEQTGSTGSPAVDGSGAPRCFAALVFDEPALVLLRSLLRRRATWTADTPRSHEAVSSWTSKGVSTRFRYIVTNLAQASVLPGRDSDRDALWRNATFADPAEIRV